MNVHFTGNSEANLTEIHIYHRDYSVSFADSFHDEITDFTIQNLSTHPRLGHEYNPEKGIFRLIYKRRYNIYYLIQDDIIHILYILDGRVSFNADLEQPEFKIPSLD